MSMLLKTKFFVPNSPVNFIERPVLSKKIDISTQKNLICVRAPAGFGKTLLVADWIKQQKYPVGWISLDEADSNTLIFSQYLITAIQAISTKCCSNFSEYLVAPIALTHLIPMIINHLLELETDSFLVLDNYHLITNEEIHTAISFLLEQMPPKLHLILISRGMPPLSSIPRLRVSYQMTEITTHDLRFSIEECVEFFKIMGLDLTIEQIEKVNNRTEGWIAGLQLSAISMQERDNLTEYIDLLSGGHQYIIDYLATEILEKNSTEIQNFLLYTSILEKMSASLCNAIIKENNSAALLETIHRQNLFTVPLDENREWYRYYHLFGDFLCNHLKRIQPEIVPTLHERAGEWFIEQRDIPTAIHHFLSGQCYEKAAEQIEQEFPTMNLLGDTSLLKEWLSSLPQSLIDQSPLLQIAYAIVTTCSNEWATAQKYIASLKSQDLPEMLSPKLPPIKEIISLIESEIYTGLGNVEQAIQNAESAFYGLKEYPIQARVGQQLLKLYLVKGDLLSIKKLHVRNFSSESLSNRQKLNQYLVNGNRNYLFGNVQNAHRLFQQGIHDVIKHNLQSLPIANAFYINMGLMELEQGDFTSAEAHIKQGIPSEISQVTTFETPVEVRGLIGLARIHRIKQEYLLAAQYLEQAEEIIFMSQNIVFTAPYLQIERIRLALFTENHHIVDRWIEDNGLTIDGKGLPLQAYEYMLLIEILLFRQQYEAIETILIQLWDAAINAEQNLLITHLSILWTVYLQEIGQEEKAQDKLLDAITKGASEKYVRIFLEHPKISYLLQKIETTNLSSSCVNYITHLLGVLPKPESLPSNSATTVNIEHKHTSLIEQLTEREKTVLSYLIQGHSNQEIADEMFVAVTTIRTHLRNLYRKLDAHSRTHAIARAIELNLTSNISR